MAKKDIEKKVTRVRYQIEVICEVNEHGAVIPHSSSNGIKDYDTGKSLNMNDYPHIDDIMVIWIGKCKQYPKAKI